MAKADKGEKQNLNVLSIALKKEEDSLDVLSVNSFRRFLR